MKIRNKFKRVVLTKGDLKKYLKYINIKNELIVNIIVDYCIDGIREGKRKSWLESKLEKLDLPDITIDNIVTFLTNPEIRERRINAIKRRKVKTLI